MDQTEAAPARAIAVALTIAGFDPSSGAGVTADLKVFAAHGIFGLASITALTVQSTTGVRAVEKILPSYAKEVLGCLSEDFCIDGIKIGMLGSAEMVAEVCRFLREHRARFPAAPVVLDPVLRSSSGRALLDDGGMELLREELLPLASCVTPNRDELAVLTGASVPLDRISGAARRLSEQTGAAVLVTGGNLERPDDLLITRSGAEHGLPGERVDTRSDHGTGCAFSSALLCGLIRGHAIEDAAARAKRYVHDALAAAVPLGHGRGPMHHLFALDRQ